MSDEAKKAFESIRTILQGTKSIEFDLEFLYRNNRTRHGYTEQDY